MPLGALGILSAHDVRQKIKGGQNITDLVPQGVLKYIKTNHLYAPNNTTMEMPWQVAAPKELYSIIKKLIPYSHIVIEENFLANQKVDLSDLLKAEKPALMVQFDGNQQNVHIKITYQQTPLHNPVTMEANCDRLKIEESCDNLLQTLIHNLINHT